MVEAGVKRKGPPTFRHLPTNRAKKLKQTWVENVKIRSKWKAQKRKELQPSASIQQDEREDDGVVEDDSDLEGGESVVEQEEDQAQAEVIPSLKRSTIHPSRAHKIPKQALPSKQLQDDKDRDLPSEPTPSLRDLTREAYSRSSLHTFKSDPLNRRKGSAMRGGRGDGERRAGHRGRGHRGQPNMKLRMDVMLEKIKRDFL